MSSMWPMVTSNMVSPELALKTKKRFQLRLSVEKELCISYSSLKRQLYYDIKQQ